MVLTDNQLNIGNISNFGLETVSIAFLNTTESVEKIMWIEVFSPYCEVFGNEMKHSQVFATSSQAELKVRRKNEIHVF